MLKYLKKAFFTLFFLFLLAIFLEILLGIAFFIKDWNNVRMEVRDHPYLYYLFEENNKGINKDGFKTQANPRKKENTIRVILTGGSVVRGGKPEQTISAHLERIAQEKWNTDRIQVINAGMSAYVLEQEFILIQTILQHYDPDMIIGIDGYNDMLTFKLNRFQEKPYPLPPHHWKDFKVIQENRYERSFAARFTYFFRNITRAVQAIDRDLREAQFSWKSVSKKELNRTARTYERTLKDLHDLCSAKGIEYHNFLQPVRFYRPSDQQRSLSPEEKKLGELYAKLEKRTTDRSYGYSLAGLLSNEPELYRDDCHVSKKGHRLIAERIHQTIGKDLQELLLQVKSKEQDHQNS